MIEWVLILTLLGNTNQSGQAIEHIPGFSSEAECRSAGNQWLKQVSGARRTYALCVRRSAVGKVRCNDCATTPTPSP